MSEVSLSKAFKFVLKDGDIVWPSTVSGEFRLSNGGEGHNTLGENEYIASEMEMIDGVLNKGKVSRFRSESNRSRIKNANHFSLSSPSVVQVFANVGGVYVQLQ